MQGDGTTSRRGYKLGAAAALALILAPAHWQGAAAGTLAQLQFQAHTAKLVPALASRFEMARAAHMDLCLGVARTANCRAALYGAIAADRGELAPDVVDPHAIALKFNEDPEWKRRAKVMAHDGLPFMRMPEAGNRELVVGITPHGMLGFSLKDTTGQ